jgi:hypothetical protein
MMAIVATLTIEAAVRVMRGRDRAIILGRDDPNTQTGARRLDL